MPITHMKRASPLLIVLAALLAGSPAALASDLITVEGGGWGHGIGMPQYGARALAESGRSGEQIIQHYYSGVQFGTVGQGNVVGHAEPLRIGVAPSSSSQRFWAVGGNVSVCLDGNPCTVAEPGQVWRLAVVDNNTCRLFRDGVAQGQPGGCKGEMTWSNQPNVRVHFPDIPNTGRTYARGKVVFTQVPNNSLRYHLLVEVGLEPYLYGLAEMPSSWHSQALRAQAIAGRSYAVSRAWTYRNLSSNSARMNQCACHLLATTQDQVYVGCAKEAESQGSRWVGAVNSTAGRVPIHTSTNGRAIDAFYFSASGGRTENVEDVWNTSAIPYLRSVGDPGARSWAAFGDAPKTFTKANFASRLGFSSVWDARITSRFVSGSPRSVVVTGIKSGVTTSQSFTGNQLRQLLGLRSHFITSITGFLPGSFAHFVVGDFLLDGKDEMAAFSTEDGSWWVFERSGQQLTGRPFGSATPTGWTRVVSGDFTGNQRTEVAMYHQSTGAWWVGRSNGSRFNFQRWAVYSTRTGWNPQLVGDFTGNGRDDIANYHAGSGTWWVSRSTGSGFSTSLWATYGTRTGWATHLVGNFCGSNSRDDIASYHPSNGTWWVSCSNGNTFSTPSLWATYTTRTGWSTHLAGNFCSNSNRDDIASYFPGNGTWWVSCSNGNTFSTPRLWSTFTTRTGWSPQIVGDFDGDGRDDIANYHAGTGRWWVSRSTGSSFSTSLKGTLSPPTGWVGQTAGDFNNNGRDDIANYYPGNRSWWVR